jgi:hypothetical protein
MTPTFTVLIGSIGRPSLRQTLDSIARQPRVPGDQVIVTIDSFEQGERRDVQALVTSYGPGFLAGAHDAGIHCWGTAQINHAWRTVPISGSHIFTVGDDDVFVDGAYATLRPLCAAEPLRPILYQFVAPWRELLWAEPIMQRSRISGCCIAAPRSFVGPHPERNANGQPYPEHDFDWMHAILAQSPPPLWLDRVLVIARPDPRGDDVTHRGVLSCWSCKQWRYLEDVDLLDPYCPHCHAVLDWPQRPVAVSA